MPKSRLEPMSKAELLLHFAGDPREAVKFVSKLYRYPNGRELEDALVRDRRFRAPLLRFLAALAESPDAVPWMLHRLVPRRDPAAVPALLQVWRAFRGKVSRAAGQVLIEIGDRRALEAMAELAGKTPAEFRVEPIDALMQLDPGRAYDRAMTALTLDPGASSFVLGEVKKAHVRADERWIALALSSLESPDKRVRGHAREIVDRLVPKAAKAALLAKTKPAAATGPESAARLDAHRATITALLESLPKNRFTPAKPNAERRLTELTAILGRIPAAARAFYERIDAIEIQRGKPRDAFIVVSLAEVLADARAWKKQHARPVKPRALTQPFHWPVSPDGATKSGYSGGPPYGFEAPTDDDDPVLDAPRKPTFSKFVTGAARLRS
jgi:hypothetical protein